MATALPGRAPSFAAQVWRVFKKDWQIELRTGEVLATTLFFSVLVTLTTSLAFSFGVEQETRVVPGALWIPVCFSSILGIARIWVREREDNAFQSLLVSPLSRAALFMGKTFAATLFLLAVDAIVFPFVSLLFHVDMGSVLLPVGLLLAAGTFGAACAGTLFGVMTVRTRARELVLSIVLFPLLLPTVLSGVAGTREVFFSVAKREPVWSVLSDYLALVLVFDGCIFFLGLLLFGALVED